MRHARCGRRSREGSRARGGEPIHSRWHLQDIHVMYSLGSSRRRVVRFAWPRLSPTPPQIRLYFILLCTYARSLLTVSPWMGVLNTFSSATAYFYSHDCVVLWSGELTIVTLVSARPVSSSHARHTGRAVGIHPVGRRSSPGPPPASTPATASSRQVVTSDWPASRSSPKGFQGVHKTTCM